MRALKNMAADTLSLLVKPASGACNLSCSYCFYRRVQEMYGESAFMGMGTARAMIRKALGFEAGLTSFCWQGGEPTLMGLDFFREAVTLQKRYRRPGQAVENTLQTNGVLLDAEWCQFLREKNILVGVSLDGPGPIHDRYRRFPDNTGTFDRVMRAVNLMRENRVRFNVLSLLTDSNIQEPQALYSFFREQGLDYLQFVNCLETDSGSGHVTPFSVGGEDVGEFFCALFDLWMEDGFPTVSIRLFEDILIYYFHRAHTSCRWMDRCSSYLVLEHNGDAYPCDFFVYPEWRLGNIVEDDLASILENPLRDKFARMKAVLPEECMTCGLKDFCNGDCTRFRRARGGAPYAGKSEYCVSLRMLLGHMSPRMPEIEEKYRSLAEPV